MAIDAETLDGRRRRATCSERIREKAKDEVRDAIRTSLGEYIDPEEEPPASGTSAGCSSGPSGCSPSRSTQNQLRKMSPPEIEELLIEAADAYYDKVDLSPIEAYLDPQYARRALADWARNKFGIDLKADEIAEGSADEVKEVICAKVRAGLRPARDVLPGRDHHQPGVRLGRHRQRVRPARQIVDWANAKYRVGWTTERFAGKSIDAIAQRTRRRPRRDFLEGGRLEREIDEALATYAASGNGELAEWAQRAVRPDAGRARPCARASRTVARCCSRPAEQLARWELTQLERYVLLRIYDQGWKDHLLEMDHLKNAIMQRPLGGDQTHPQSQYAIEGREQFEQMWKIIRDRVTDMIFKVSARPAGGEAAEESAATEHQAAGPPRLGHRGGLRRGLRRPGRRPCGPRAKAPSRSPSAGSSPRSAATTPALAVRARNTNNAVEGSSAVSVQGRRSKESMQCVGSTRRTNRSARGETSKEIWDRHSRTSDSEKRFDRNERRRSRSRPACPARMSRRAAAGRADPRRPEGNRPQRSLPLRFGQEVQEVLR